MMWALDAQLVTVRIVSAQLVSVCARVLRAYYKVGGQLTVFRCLNTIRASQFCRHSPFAYPQFQSLEQLPP